MTFAASSCSPIFNFCGGAAMAMTSPSRRIQWSSALTALDTPLPDSTSPSEPTLHKRVRNNSGLSFKSSSLRPHALETSNLRELRKVAAPPKTPFGNDRSAALAIDALDLGVCPAALQAPARGRGSIPLLVVPRSPGKWSSHDPAIVGFARTRAAKGDHAVCHELAQLIPPVLVGGWVATIRSAANSTFIDFLIHRSPVLPHDQEPLALGGVKAFFWHSWWVWLRRATFGRVSSLPPMF